MYKLAIIYLFSVLFALCCHPRTSQISNKSGEALRQELAKKYKPKTVLSYADARDILYSKIDKKGDSVHCFYTDYALYLPKNVDASTHLSQNNSAEGINCEHSYPKSKGAKGQAKSDMHHLFPTKNGVNNSRGNNPYDEVVDSETTHWYYKSEHLKEIPSRNIDAYSEKGRAAFEPREAVKGDVARAVFYFYTMYREEALAADPTFFEQQRKTLCAWHKLDPVSPEELKRTKNIANFQDGKANPFVLDESLVVRCYCLD